MELIKDIRISKSFYWLGQSLDHCFGCSYCRALTGKNTSYDRLPSSINPLFRELPVVINLQYGDPCLQADTTRHYLQRLEDDKHTGPVIIITKGNLKSLGPLAYDLKINIALSTIGKYHEVDKVSHYNFLENLDYLKCLPPRIKFSCEFRPIMYQINDDPDTIWSLFCLCSDYNLPIGYSGLQGDPELVKYWEENNLKFKPFPGYEFSMKKPVSQECYETIQECANFYQLPFFKKTSCLVSYTNNLLRDYNSHYYRPNELECKTCFMKSTCETFKNNLQFYDINKLRSLIPFDFEVVIKTNHKCLMHDTCPNPHQDCTKISGYLVSIKEKITTADVRVIKWLTGYTVAAPFYESPYISTKWLK
jgi:hypothetical protein